MGVWCCAAWGLLAGSVLLAAARGAGGCSGSCSCCHTAVSAAGKGECWAQVVHRSCQNAPMHLTQALPLPCCKAAVTPQLSVCPSWQEPAWQPRALGWDAGVGSSVCFPREAELFFFVTLLPGPEFAEEVLQFSMVLAEEEVLVGKVLKKLPACVEASTLHMQIFAVLFSLTLFSSILHFTYCWGCLCSPDNPFGNTLYRAVGLLVLTAGRQVTHPYLHRFLQVCRGGPCRAESESPAVTRPLLHIWCQKQITLRF